MKNIKKELMLVFIEKVERNMAGNTYVSVSTTVNRYIGNDLWFGIRIDILENIKERICGKR